MNQRMMNQRMMNQRMMKGGAQPAQTRVVRKAVFRPLRRRGLAAGHHTSGRAGRRGHRPEPYMYPRWLSWEEGRLH